MKVNDLEIINGYLFDILIRKLYFMISEENQKIYSVTNLKDAPKSMEVQTSATDWKICFQIILYGK